MNFKILTLVTIIFISSCGVKSDPRAPRDTLLPSYDAQYTKMPIIIDEKEKSIEKPKEKSNNENVLQDEN